MAQLADLSAVIFDMDGLVLDTESTFRVAWKEAAKRLGYELSESFFRELSGLPGEGVLHAFKSHFGDRFDWVEFNRLSAQLWRSHVSDHGIEIKHGFELLLDFLVLNNIPYCLATNSEAAIASECLERAGLNDVFSIMITREQVRMGKPAPDLFLAAAKRLQVPIQRCLVLEDSLVGIEAASRAGAISALIAPDRSIASEASGFCDVHMRDLEQLLECIRDVRRGP